MIAGEELQSVGHYSTAADVVRSLRPQWLRTRGAPSISNGVPVVAIYLDDVKFGEGEAGLRSVPAATLAHLEWFDPPEATQRWGTGHAGGVISIHTVAGMRLGVR